MTLLFFNYSFCGSGFLYQSQNLRIHSASRQGSYWHPNEVPPLGRGVLLAWAYDFIFCGSQPCWESRSPLELEQPNLTLSVSGSLQGKEVRPDIE